MDPLSRTSAGHLTAIVRRLQALEAEIDKLNDEKRELYAEARMCGFDLPGLRRALQMLRKNRTDLQEQESTAKAYLDAIRGVAERVRLEGDAFDPFKD